LNVAILSDIHANFDALLAVEAELARRRPDRIYHLGDLAGYNAQPEECVRWAMANTWAFHAAARKAALWSRDRISPEGRDYLSRLPVQRFIEGGALLVHGAPSDPGRYVDSVEYAAQELSTLFASVATGPIFFGHTHEAGGFVRREDGRVEPVPAKEFRLLPGERALLNPGSVGQPRDRSRDASFLLFDTVDRTVTWFRVPYDVEAARRKVLEAGLPREFADRLRDGT
jgi:diadenosine tetraphosphatase ApaH/serine/threonine PP2A family protein phosphatase